MKIWILNHYATNQFFENGGRHYDFAKYLKRAGHDPVVFCCNAKHNTRSELCFDMNGAWQEHQAEAIGVPFVFVKGRPYIGNGKQRILNMIDYFHNVQKATLDYAKLHGAPDVLIGSSVHPLACIAAIKLSKRLHCKNIVEIRDLWPESLAAYGLVGKKNPLLKAMLACEKWIYTKADVIIFTMAGGRDYIVEKGWDTSHGGSVDLAKVHHINNGVDLEAFESNKARYVWKDSDLDDPHTFKVIYTGSIRAVNNLSLLVDAAVYLRAANDHDIKLLIFGDGDQREALVTRCLQAGLHNICFKDKVEKKYIPYILSKGDLTFLHGGYTPIMRYGMSANKLFEYFAAGKPVLSDIRVNYDLILHCNAGIVATSQTPSAICEAIKTMRSLQECALWEMGKNAQRAAEQNSAVYHTQELIKCVSQEEGIVIK